jgi:hypothetical protein
MASRTFSALVVREEGDGEFRREVQERQVDDLTGRGIRRVADRPGLC